MCVECKWTTLWRQRVVLSGAWRIYESCSKSCTRITPRSLPKNTLPMKLRAKSLLRFAMLMFIESSLVFPNGQVSSYAYTRLIDGAWGILFLGCLSVYVHAYVRACLNGENHWPACRRLLVAVTFLRLTSGWSTLRCKGTTFLYLWLSANSVPARPSS